MTAVSTASRWHAIHPDYKSGSPTDSTAGILRLTTDQGTVLVPAEVVDRQRLFAFGPLVATPGALRTLVAEGAGPARLLDRRGAGDWGHLCAEDHDANDEAVRSGERILSAYDIGSTRLWVITDAETEDPWTTRVCVLATPPACYCLPNTDGSAGCRRERPHPTKPPSSKGASICPFHRIRRACTYASTPVHQRGALRPAGGMPRRLEAHAFPRWEGPRWGGMTLKVTSPSTVGSWLLFDPRAYGRGHPLGRAPQPRPMEFGPSPSTSDRIVVAPEVSTAPGTASRTGGVWTTPPVIPAPNRPGMAALNAMARALRREAGEWTAKVTWSSGGAFTVRGCISFEIRPWPKC
jgi:hypothetical protein